MSFALKSAQSKALRPAAASRRASVAVKAGKASMLQRWHTARQQQCSFDEGSWRSAQQPEPCTHAAAHH